MPTVVPGLSTGSSSLSASSSSTSSPHNTSGGISPSPAIQRSDGTYAQTSRNRGDPTKTKNKNKNNSQASSNRVRDVPDWLQELTENLEDTEVPALRDTPANTTQDSDSERPIEVVSSKAQH